MTGFFLHCMCQVAAQSGEANASSLRQLLGEQRKCMGREAGFGSTRRGAWTSAEHFGEFYEQGLEGPAIGRQCR